VSQLPYRLSVSFASPVIPTPHVDEHCSATQCSVTQPLRLIGKNSFEYGVHLSLDMVYCRGGQPIRDQERHFLLCYRKEPRHTHGHIWTSPDLFLTHAHTFTQLDLL